MQTQTPIHHQPSSEPLPKPAITDAIPFIKQIEIKGLFGKKDILWDLKDVNVLVGQNGSGKSTILRMVHQMLHLTMGDSVDVELIKAINITFANGYRCSVSRGPANIEVDNLKLSEFIKQRKKSIQMDENSSESNRDDLASIEKILAELEKNLAGLEEMRRRNGLVDCIETNIFFGKTPDNLLEKVNVEFLSTFDMMLLTKKEQDDISGDIFTQLDLVLNKEISRLTQYQLALLKQTAKEYKKKGNKKSFATVESDKFKRINKFEKALNAMFNPNDKHFSISDSGQIEVHYGGEKLPLTALSSGEKQLILILLRVVNTSDKPTILLLDEPEISLHLTWQESLIKTIKGINEHCQLVIVTHSPALVMNGWMDSYIDLKDICTDSK